MIIQGILPLSCMSLLLVVCILLMFNFESLLLRQLLMLSFLPLNWLPLLNPVVTIFTVKV